LLVYEDKVATSDFSLPPVLPCGAYDRGQVLPIDVRRTVMRELLQKRKSGRSLADFFVVEGLLK